MKRRPIDRAYLAIVIILSLVGFAVFSSAALGLLAYSGPSVAPVFLNQGMALVIGFIIFFIASTIDYRKYRSWAFYTFLVAVFLNLALFIPHLSFYYNGASRWINLGPISFQPSEFLKIAFIIYFAAWLAHKKSSVDNPKFGILPFGMIMVILGVLLLAQSDTDTFAIIFMTGLGMLLIGGGKLSHIGFGLIGIILIVLIVAWVRPYARERIITYLDPASDPQGAGYQLEQSLIAVGSGGIWGTGYGEGIQKFGFLPEPIGDSIFAVAAQEAGFIGATILVILYVVFAVKSLRIATRAPDMFGCLIASGVAVLVIAESFLNIGAEIGLLPLSGIPLLFVSHGGTALVIALGTAGIVANISRQIK